MSNKNLTKTLFADFRKVDTKKLNINGNPFSKVVTDNVPETPTENDIWKYAVTTDDKGVVTVTDDVAVDYTEITAAQKNITKTAAKVIDNEVLNSVNYLLMNWDTKNFTNENNSSMGSIFDGSYSQKPPITEWDSDLSSLTCGGYMFAYCSSLASFSGDLSSLENGASMFFECTNLTSFNEDLPKLTDGGKMFYHSALQSFNGNLSNLTNGNHMFYQSDIVSFNSDLSSLTYGGYMFTYCSSLTSFSSDLPNLTNGDMMFYNTALASFNGDLPSLTNGKDMFEYATNLTSFNGDLSNLVIGVDMFINCSNLTSFISNLSSLKSGHSMFGSSSASCSSLDEDSIMLIADTINNISSLNKSVDSDWTYTYHDDDTTVVTSSISSYNRGILHLGYDATTITDTTNIFKYCDEIVAKGWTVYLNGSKYTSTDSGSVALIDGESSITPIPHYYKPVQVTDEEIAEYVDGNGNLFIIVGAQHVFGDDISTYGMFTSYEHAVSEISLRFGLTPYVKPTEE